MRRTKLICTVGPASLDRLPALIEAGMDVARVNCSHGTRAQRRATFERVRAARLPGSPLSILADLGGPKVRLAGLDDALDLHEGGSFLLTATPSGSPTGSWACTNHPGLIADVRLRDRLLLADGMVELEVVECRSGEVVTEVVRGGRVGRGCGITIPSDRLSIPSLTEKDREDLQDAVELGADAVAGSFVRGGADVRALRALVGARPVAVLAKIETRVGVDNAGAILEEADGIIVGRGDLGAELPMEEIPMIQKGLTRRAQAAGKPVIVATEMLQSMIESWRPTRAEASDIANAVLDGADGVLLSAETAIGRHPVESARAAVRIIAAVERAVGVPEEPVGGWMQMGTPVIEERRLA